MDDYDIRRLIEYSAENFGHELVLALKEMRKDHGLAVDAAIDVTGIELHLEHIAHALDRIGDLLEVRR